jgi:hypothetical protein
MVPRLLEFRMNKISFESVQMDLDVYFLMQLQTRIYAK